LGVGVRPNPESEFGQISAPAHLPQATIGQAATSKTPRWEESRAIRRRLAARQPRVVSRKMPVVSAIGPPPLTVAVVGRLADQPADHVAVRPNAFRCPLNCSVINDRHLENWLTPGCDFTALLLGPRVLRKRTVGRRHEDAEHIAPSLSLLAKLWCLQHVPIGFANGRNISAQKNCQVVICPGSPQRGRKPNDTFSAARQCGDRALLRTEQRL
jgi:hypothetical protein